MRAKAQAILDQIRGLPHDEQCQVLDEAVRLRERMREWEQQKAKIRAMQSRHAGSGMLSRLLAGRTKERARG